MKSLLPLTNWHGIQAPFQLVAVRWFIFQILSFSVNNNNYNDNNDYNEIELCFIISLYKKI